MSVSTPDDLVETDLVNDGSIVGFPGSREPMICDSCGDGSYPIKGAELPPGFVLFEAPDLHNAPQLLCLACKHQELHTLQSADRLEHDFTPSAA